MTAPPAIPTPERHRTLRFAVLLFAASFVLRLLFWQSAPDSAWPYSAYYKGDAPVWLDYTRALINGSVFEWNLPLRPPGMAYLLEVLWDGSPGSVATLRGLWCFLGSLLPPLFFLASVRPFGFRVASLAGVGMAASTGLLMLSTSLNNETPYLILVALSLLLLDRSATRPGWGGPATWALVQGVACLVRAEHLLFVLFSLGYLVASWRPLTSRLFPRMAVVGCFFVLPLVPWHVSAWRTLSEFNANRQNLGETIEGSVTVFETAARDLVWEDGAREEVENLPAFARHLWSAMVATTVLYRGETTVREVDVGILEKAFGALPEPLPEYPFVTVYGPLNFYLANHDSAAGGFSRSVLEVPPPLEGGAHTYPPFFARDFPPEDNLAPWYPPHLAVLNHGYAMGIRWILSHPDEYLVLAGHKLFRFWCGAALGASGYGLPLGIGGVRYAVDLVVPKTDLASSLWRLAFLGAFLAGLAASRRNRSAVPWILFFAAQTVVVLLFFGYARIGAMTIPVAAVFVSTAAVRWIPRVSRIQLRAWTLAMTALLIGFCALEAARALDPPEVYVRQRKVVDRDPYPPGLYIDQVVTVRPRGD